MADYGNSIIWSTQPADDYDQLTDEEKQIFIEMATPTSEQIEATQAAIVTELKPFLDATLKEDEVIIG